MKKIRLKPGWSTHIFTQMEQASVCATAPLLMFSRISYLCPQIFTKTQNHEKNFLLIDAGSYFSERLPSTR